MGQKHITQKFNLYNVAGLIDKDKNIYFVPQKSALYRARLEAQSIVIQGVYNYLFNEVCPFSSDYHDVVISQWSPEDRSLVIEGTIDDFRQSRGRGLALNYMIVERQVFNPETQTGYIYYYAFFIDSVEEVGINSVRLNVSPDYFTNFFYLSNIDTITPTYDPFNSIMKNAFIERQHYNRVDYSFEKINEEMFLNNQEVYNYRYQYKDFRIPLVLTGGTVNEDNVKSIISSLKTITTFEGFYAYMSNLSDTNKKIVAMLLTKFIHIKFKENVLSPMLVENIIDEVKYGVYKVGSMPDTKDKTIRNNLIHIIRPVVDIPQELSNISPKWIEYICKINVSSDAMVYAKYYIGNGEYFTQLTEGLSEYIYDFFVTKHSNWFIDNFETIDVTNDKVGIMFKTNSQIFFGETEPTQPTYQNANVTSMLCEESILGFLPSKQDLDNYNSISETPVTMPIVIVHGNYGTHGDEFTPSVNYMNNLGGLERLCVVLRNADSTETNIVIRDTNEFASNKYYEPILETEPYSFWSISLYETESILNKSRYYQSKIMDGNVEKYKVPLVMVQSFTDSYKIGLIPVYTLNTVSLRYYNDALVMTLPSSLPYTSDSYFAYYYQNKSQMKNQFAVNSFTGVTDLAQSFFNTAPAQIGAGFLGGGEGTGYAQIVKQVSGLIDQGIDIAQATKVIDMNQKSLLADMGAKPDTVKQAGSDILYQALVGELGAYINHYTIDTISYNSIAKHMERFGYLVNVYDSIHAFDRIGLNYVKLKSFDFVEDNVKLSIEEMNEVSRIFIEGVTLLHNKEYLHNIGEEDYHNIETIIAS